MEFYFSAASGNSATLLQCKDILGNSEHLLVIVLFFIQRNFIYIFISSPFRFILSEVGNLTNKFVSQKKKDHK